MWAALVGTVARANDESSTNTRSRIKNIFERYVDHSYERLLFSVNNTVRDFGAEKTRLEA